MLMAKLQAKGYKLCLLQAIRVRGVKSIFDLPSIDESANAGPGELVPDGGSFLRPFKE